MTTQMLQLDTIRTDGGTQARAGLNDQVIEDYAAAMQRDERFPPVVVFYDGQDYWLGDGFHRLAAAAQAGLGAFAAEVRQGQRRDAVMYAAGANSAHGLRRTTADKQRAIDALLRDPEWMTWSDSEIARRCAVDHKTVGARRVALEATGEIPRSDTRKTADGREMDTSGITAAAAARATAASADEEIASIEATPPTPTTNTPSAQRQTGSSGGGGGGSSSKAPEQRRPAPGPAAPPLNMTPAAPAPLPPTLDMTPAPAAGQDGTPTAALLKAKLAYEFAREVARIANEHYDTMQDRLFEDGKEAIFRFDLDQIRAAAPVFLASQAFVAQAGMFGFTASVEVVDAGDVEISAE